MYVRSWIVARASELRLRSNEACVSFDLLPDEILNLAFVSRLSSLSVPPLVLACAGGGLLAESEGVVGISWGMGVGWGEVGGKWI